MKNSGRETLAQRVKRLREKNKLSLSQVERNSGGRITNGYVSRIENGYETNLTVDIIKALAEGLQVPQSALLDVMFDNVSPSDSGEEEIVLYYRSMNETARGFLMLVARAFKAHKIQVIKPAEVEGNVKSTEQRKRKQTAD
jgi:transcriptional regulator with XRE-family HTH domain